MTNEWLVARIKAGDRELLPELWNQVERFVAQQARRRLILSGGFGGVAFEDLYNAGYLATLRAVNSFDPTAGRSFVSWLSLSLRTAFAEAGGYRSQKQSKDPLHLAGSLDMPIADSEDAATLGDIIPDPQALQALEQVEHQMYLDQLHAALERVMAALPEQQRRTLKRRYYQGQTFGEIAADEGTDVRTVRQWHDRALRELRRPQVRRELNLLVREV